jgi:hypothetical protein
LCVVKCRPAGGGSCLASRDFFVIDNSLPATYHMRLRYAGIARVKQQIDEGHF